MRFSIKSTSLFPFCSAWSYSGLSIELTCARGSAVCSFGHWAHSYPSVMSLPCTLGRDRQHVDLARVVLLSFRTLWIVDSVLIVVGTVMVLLKFTRLSDTAKHV